MPPFRINSKAFFLTYPQCPIIPETLGAHLESLGQHQFVLVAQELHEDGNWHLHALVIYIEKKNIRDPNYFDFEGYHCNAQSTRDRDAVRKYILKHDPVEDACYSSGTFEDGKAGGATRAAWEAAMNATTPEEVMQRVAEASPRDYVLSYDKVEGFARTKANMRAAYVPNADDIFTLPDILRDWVTVEYINRVRNEFSPTRDTGPPTGANPGS